VVEVLGDVAGARPGHSTEPSGIVHVTIRLLLFVFYKKSAPFWPDPMGASNHITYFIKSKGWG
jgi:hypothetical protein